MPFYGWVVTLVATLVTFASGPGQSYVFAVFVDPIIDDTGLSRTFVSTLYAVGTGFSAAMIMVVSRLVDRFGARIMLVVIAGLTGIACIGMSAVYGPIGLLLGFAALRALGQGSLPITSVILVAQWFVRYRGRAMSILAIGFAASNAAFPPFARFMIEEIGWRGAYVTLGIIVWALIIPATILFVRNQPEDMGLHPDGAYEPVGGRLCVAGIGLPTSTLPRRRVCRLTGPATTRTDVTIIEELTAVAGTRASSMLAGDWRG